MSDILKQAHDIIYREGAEAARNYGPFTDTMHRAAEILRAVSPHLVDFTTRDMFMALIALKLSREAYSHKEDNLVDLCGYAAGLNDMLTEQQENDACRRR